MRYNNNNNSNGFMNNNSSNGFTFNPSNNINSSNFNLISSFGKKESTLQSEGVVPIPEAKVQITEKCTI
jgi:hypothetical protein